MPGWRHGGVEGCGPRLSAQIYTTFFCRQNEPSYIRSLKLEILAAIADETNAYEIATELTEYVNDPDEQLAREAVRAVGRIAIEVRPASACAPSIPYPRHHRPA